jgi:hypothetical protein
MDQLFNYEDRHVIEMDIKYYEEMNSRYEKEILSFQKKLKHKHNIMRNKEDLKNIETKARRASFA